MLVFQKTRYLLLSLVLAFNAHSAQCAILQQQLLGTGLRVFDQPSSGNNNCLYDAVSDQLSRRGLQQHAGPDLRQRSEGVIEQQIRNLQQRNAGQVIDRKSLYQQELYRKGDQGSLLNIQALAESLNVNIVVISTIAGNQEFRPPVGGPALGTVYIGHDGDVGGGHFVSLQGVVMGMPPLVQMPLVNLARYLIAFNQDRDVFKIVPDSSMQAIIRNFSMHINQRIEAKSLGFFSAGQEDELNNQLWVKGSLGRGVDKSIEGDKLTTTSRSLTIGYDRYLNQDIILGLALGFADNKLISSQNHTLRLKGVTGAIYGSLEFSDNILSSSVFAGHFRGKAKLADFEGSSFPVTTYGANIELAHRFVQEKHIFIPAVGLQYSGFKQNAYQDESVTIVQYSARRGQVFDGILSVKYACNLEKESVKIIPSVKLGVVRNLTLKADNIKYSIDGYNNDAAITIPISRKKQTTFFALPSLSFSWPGAEVCVFYRLDKANKSFANTVSAKIAANF